MRTCLRRYEGKHASHHDTMSTTGMQTRETQSIRIMMLSRFPAFAIPSSAEQGKRIAKGRKGENTETVLRPKISNSESAEYGEGETPRHDEHVQRIACRGGLIPQPFAKRELMYVVFARRTTDLSP
jgi:hypothetical protein